MKVPLDPNACHTHSCLVDCVRSEHPSTTLRLVSRVRRRVGPIGSPPSSHPGRLVQRQLGLPSAGRLPHESNPTWLDVGAVAMVWIGNDESTTITTKTKDDRRSTTEEIMRTKNENRHLSSFYFISRENTAIMKRDGSRVYFPVSPFMSSMFIACIIPTFQCF